MKTCKHCGNPLKENKHDKQISLFGIGWAEKLLTFKK
jgi:hypothetical protein